MRSLSTKLAGGTRSSSPAIAREGNPIGAIRPLDPSIVHVVIADKHVKKVEKTIGRAPETKPHRHRERASFEYRLTGIAGVAFSPDGELVAAAGRCAPRCICARFLRAESGPRSGFQGWSKLMATDCCARSRFLLTAGF